MKGTIDRKAPACLLTLVYAYGKPCLPPVHKYSSLRSTAHRGAAGRCAGRSIVVKVQSQVLNRRYHETHSLITHYLGNR